jgi:hypothetical protein
MKNTKTKVLKVTVNCLACYESEIVVPDCLTRDEAIEYAKQNLDSIPVGVLSWIDDSEIDEDFCDFEVEI